MSQNRTLVMSYNTDPAIVTSLDEAVRKAVCLVEGRIDLKASIGLTIVVEWDDEVGDLVQTWKLRQTNVHKNWQSVEREREERSPVATIRADGNLSDSLSDSLRAELEEEETEP